MKWFSLATLLVVLCAMNTVNGQAATIGDLISQITTVVGQALPFFAQFIGQLSMPVLDPTKDYTSLSAINDQLTQLITTFQNYSPYLVWIVQPGNAKTPLEQSFAAAVTSFANVLPQINQMLNIVLSSITNASG